MPDVQVVNHAHDVGGDRVLAQQVVSAHGLLVSRLAAPGHAIWVVQFRRSVQAETDVETFRREKTAPLFVQQDAIRLDAVAHAPAGGPVLALKFDGLPEEVHAQSGGLSSMPGEVNLCPGRGLDMLDDVVFQQAFLHPEYACIRIETPLVAVIAVGAIEITGSPGRFDKDLELPGYLSHGSSFRLPRARRAPDSGLRTKSDFRTLQCVFGRSGPKLLLPAEKKAPNRTRWSTMEI